MFAERLGISQSTVSRALAGHEQISAKTRQRVAEAAAELGYRPNQAARRLATGRANAIGLVFPLARLLMAQTNFVDVLAGITGALKQRDFDLVLAPFDEDDEESILRRLAATRSVDGIIVTRARVHDYRVPLLHSLGLPFILHGRTETDTPYSFVDIDNEAIFMKPANLLLNLGHKRIATLNGLPEFMYSATRRRGFHRACEARGILPDPALQHETSMTEESGYALTMQMLASPSPPTAIICGALFLAQGVYRALKEHALQPGRDISVIAHDDQLRGIHANSFEPSLTTTAASVRLSGEHLGEFIVDQILHPEKNIQPKQDIAPVDLVVRDSIGPPPGR
ncbi:transcriptional regulator, LacI family [Collimonas sp. OK607]|nr:transcriptional regulator, LacI family [Collimonas sp. OK607]